MTNNLDICEEDAIHIPTEECTDCSQFAEDLEDLSNDFTALSVNVENAEEAAGQAITLASDGPAYYETTFTGPVPLRSNMRISPCTITLPTPGVYVIQFACFFNLNTVSVSNPAFTWQVGWTRGAGDVTEIGSESYTLWDEMKTGSVLPNTINHMFTLNVTDDTVWKLNLLAVGSGSASVQVIDGSYHLHIIRVRQNPPALDVTVATQV